LFRRRRERSSKPHVAWCRASHSSIFFARGTELEDEGGVLEGGGKVLRYITLRTPADAKRREVKDFVRKAFALVPKPRAKRPSTRKSP
jgi:hypothetical protein